MKEKDIKEILDDKFESMAPDLVNKICENKIEKIKIEALFLVLSVLNTPGDLPYGWIHSAFLLFLYNLIP